MDKPLKVEVSSVVFHNPANGYVIARAKAASEPGMVTIVGEMGKLSPGETLELTGEWVEHPKYGRQFTVHLCEHSMPATANGVIKFLSSNIKGIGPKSAERMVDKFGVEVLDLLDTDPDKLLEVHGISKKKLDGIIESWRSQRAVKDLIVFLHSHDIPPTYAAKIFRIYGAQAIQMIEENPYDLAYEVRGIGFKKADAMALKLGFEPESPKRLEAALEFCLTSQSERAGHLYLPEDELLSATSDMLGGTDIALLEDAIAGLEQKKRVVLEELDGTLRRAVYSAKFFRYEQQTANRLHGLVSHPCPVSSEKVRAILPQIETNLGFSLSDEQKDAVFKACANKVFIVTGGPGTGKTTITKAIVKTLRKLGLKVKLAAPTGRAAKRLQETTGYSALTIHRLLQYAPDGGFTYNEDQKLKTDVLVVDEASMLDAQLTLAVLKALPLTSRLILVGDVNQLPSVGPGNVLSDMLTSETIPSSRLNTIFRQAQESTIVVNAHRINQGEFPIACTKEPPDADFYWIRQEDPFKIQDMVLEMICERIPKRFGLDPMRDVQILTPMHKGELGTQAMNSLLQDKLNPARGPELVKGRTRFRKGDRILMLRNNYEKEVFNGDLGWVVEIDPEEGELIAEFDSRQVEFEPTELDDLSLAYAISVHKSQGSEYPAVIIPVVTQHFILLQRNLIYTALTRARKLGIMIGTNKALSIGLNTAGSGKRYTRLKERLQSVFAQETLF